MRRKENKDYGKIIDYDPQWKGPLDIERKQTDFTFLVSFGIYIAVWSCVGVYAFRTGQVKHSHNLLFELSEIDTNVSSLGYIALGAVGLGILLSFIYLLLLRHYPKTVVFTAIIVFFVMLVAVIGVLSHQLATNQQNNNNTLSALIGFIITFVILLIVFIAYRKKVVIACGVIKEATKAVWFFPSSFLFSILPFIFYVITFIFAAHVFYYLSANPAMESNYEGSAVHLYLFHAVNVFGFLWTLNFIYGFSQMVLSGTFATWFWTLNKERVPSLVIFKFISVTTRFHLGTIAFGSLIIAIIQAIKMLLKAASDRAGRDGNNFGALLMTCFRGLCGVVENFIEYINSNAYIMCTVHGTKFYQSAKDAFNLLMRNVVNVIVITDVIGMIMFLGNLIVIGLSLLGTFICCKDATAQEYVVAGAFALTVSGSIFEILKNAVNTIFLCVLEDYERNDGSSERPYFMPYKLRQLLIQDT